MGSTGRAVQKAPVVEGGRTSAVACELLALPMRRMKLSATLPQWAISSALVDAFPRGVPPRAKSIVTHLDRGIRCAQQRTEILMQTATERSFWTSDRQAWVSSREMLQWNLPWSAFGVT